MYLYGGSNPLAYLHVPTQLLVTVGRCNETSVPVNTRRNSKARALRWAERLQEAFGNPAGVLGVRCQNTHRLNHTADRLLCSETHSSQRHVMPRSDGSTTCNCSLRA